MIDMRRSLAFFALAALVGAAAFAQSRENVRIYVQSVADDPSHTVFFRERFAEEIEGAGYGLAYRANAADYILSLTVGPHLILYDDGWGQAPPNDKQFSLRIVLTRSQDNAEIVSFAFPFTSLDEMLAYNQYLFYQVMTNLPYSVEDTAPATPAETARDTSPWVGPERIERERIVEVPGPERIVEVPGPERVVEVPGPERIVEVPGPERIVEVPGPERVIEVPMPVEVQVVEYVPVPMEVPVPTDVPAPVDVPVSTDVPAPARVPQPVDDTNDRVVFTFRSDMWRNKVLYLRVSADVPASYFKVRPNQSTSITNKLRIMPGGTLGLELQFLDWMSVELDFMARFVDVWYNSFNPGAALQLKFPIKPAGFMLEPYGAAAFSMNRAKDSATPYYLEAGGGVQLGFKGGQSGAWFFDVNFMHTFNNVLNKSMPKFLPNVIKEIKTDNPTVKWNRFVIGLDVGYKFGFKNRIR